MDDDRTITCLQDDADEALSLTDFPLDHHHSPTADSPPRTHRSSSSPPDLFEFLNDKHITNSASDVMCSADDIIVCGKLMPFNPTRNQERTKLPLRSRSDSSSVVQKGSSAAVKLTRSSRSVDGTTTSYVRGSIGKPEFGPESKRGGTMTRPRWYVYLMMFGVAKFQTEMELRDIRTRQLRRTASVDGQVVVGGEKFPANRSGSWKLLKALSCKDHANVAVATMGINESSYSRSVRTIL